MSGWDWLPVGLAAWFVVSVATGLIVGPILRSCSQALEQVDDNLDKTSHQS